MELDIGVEAISQQTVINARVYMCVCAVMGPTVSVRFCLFSGFLVVGGCCWSMDGAGALVFQFGVSLDCVFTSYWWLPRHVGGRGRCICVCVRLLEVSVWPIE